MKNISSVTSQRGATMVEAAAALPLFVLFLAGCFGIGGFIEARAQLYEQVASTSRELSTAAFGCGNVDSETTAISGEFHSVLAKRGYAGNIVITPLNSAESEASDPAEIAKWKLEASLSTSCALCGPMKLAGFFPESISASKVIWAETPGCIPS